MDVALVSCLSLPEPDPDATPLSAALAAAGIHAEVVAWDDPTVDWSRARLTVLRSSWNYPRHHAAFLAWVDRIFEVSELWNPPAVVRWNTHKRYLLDLERRGVPVTPTVLVEQGCEVTLQVVIDERGWSEVVVKPAVSAASRGTLRVGPRDLSAGETHLRRLVRDGDALVQPYLSAVEKHGERSLVWIDGELTHAVRKSPRFEGQAEAVSPAAVSIEPSEAALARLAIAAVDGPLLYARVDVAPDAKGEPVLMELELVEPSLFFNQCPGALDRFVAAVFTRL